MEFITDKRDLIDLIQIRGKLDYAASNDFDAKLRGLLHKQGRRFFLMDFSQVTILSSPSLRAILAMAKRLRRIHGHLIILNPSDVAHECLKISGFIKLNMFEIETDAHRALERLEALAKIAPPEPGEDVPASIPSELTPNPLLADSPLADKTPASLPNRFFPPTPKPAEPAAEAAPVADPAPPTPVPAPVPAPEPVKPVVNPVPPAPVAEPAKQEGMFSQLMAQFKEAVDYWLLGKRG